MFSDDVLANTYYDSNVLKTIRKADLVIVSDNDCSRLIWSSFQTMIAQYWSGLKANEIQR